MPPLAGAAGFVQLPTEPILAKPVGSSGGSGSSSGRSRRSNAMLGIAAGAMAITAATVFAANQDSNKRRDD